jgi:hypothetical protein
MPRTPKEKPKTDEPEPKDSTWAEDQKDRGYYYDDAHGYETFDPEKDDESDEEDD